MNIPQQKPIQWENELFSEWPLMAIMKHFQVNNYLFLVLDEVDIVLNFPISIRYGMTLEVIGRYYDLWKMIDPVILNTGTSVCCCGRSSILFAIGRHMYRSQGIVSPGIAEQFLLSPFKLEDIIGCVAAVQALREDLCTFQLLLSINVYVRQN
jgi:hypothetical protein